MPHLSAGRNSFSPSTANFPGFATRQASSHRMPNVSAASMESYVSRPFRPSTAKADCPLRNKPRAYTGPKDHSKSIDELSRSTVKPGKRRGSTRCSTRWYATRAASFTVGVRRTRSRQISSLVSFACPSRCTASRRISFFTSASKTRRTKFRSSDHRCNRHLFRSPEMEYFD